MREKISLFITVALVGLSLFVWIKRFYKSVKSRKNADKILSEPILTTQKRKAVLIKKNMDMEYEGSVRFPKHNVKLSVLFELSDGSKKSFTVDKDLFDGMKEGDRGELVFTDERLLAFEQE